ncbi:MAG: prepilin-type N-terminal cleavage/methylation domain-containing protein [Desulfobacteraceae bacterium]|nr:prepilin-type N-terminal cleavage/methylation domain-containing protein [Desulfobacteraceae bacterium]
MKNRFQSGFTLLELLIAITIFAVIATLVYSTFNAVISKTDAIKEESTVNEMAAACLNRISMDLQALYVEQYPLYKPPDYDDDPDPYRFVGETEYIGGEQFPRLGFASTEHLPMSGKQKPASGNSGAIPSGLARIRYHVDKPGDAAPDSGYVLKRGDTPWPYDDSDGIDRDPEKDPVLCTDISELRFIYLDEKGDEFETWDSEAEDMDYATPRAVQVYLKIDIGSRQYPFSTRVVLPVFREPLERAEK